RVFVCEAFRAHKGVGDNTGKEGTQWLAADLSAKTVDDRLAYHLRLLGEKARDWVIETDRLRELVDTDGDGRADRSTVFATGFNRLIEGHGAGVLARRGDVYYACIPNLWRMRDTDGDGVADVRDVLHTGYGVRVAFHGHDLHGLTPGPDGRIYFTVGDRGYHVVHEGRTHADPESGAVFRCAPDGSRLEVVHTGLRNPQELAFDDLGNLFTVDNNCDSGDRARLVQIVPGGDTGWRMSVQYLPDRGPFNRERIWHLAHDGQPAWIVPPLAHIGSGPSGFAAYPGPGLPPHFDGRFLLADFRGAAANSSVRTFRVQPKGASFEATDEEETFKHVLATDVEIGPDGAVWVSDWVHGWQGEGKGRLWRFVPSLPVLSPTPLCARKASQTNTRPRSSIEKATGLATSGSAANGSTVNPAGRPNPAAALAASSEAAAIVGSRGGGGGSIDSAAAAAPAIVTRTQRIVTGNGFMGCRWLWGKKGAFCFFFQRASTDESSNW
ncbi:MAG: PVC-type heme-binding CxxCH protein, partial [Planctomycetia bacterium]